MRFLRHQIRLRHSRQNTASSAAPNHGRNGCSGAIVARNPTAGFSSFRHRARSSPHQRRICYKAEHTVVGTNLRFLITNCSGPASTVFAFYNDRGECENRIEEFKDGFRADRLSFTAPRRRLPPPATRLRLQPRQPVPLQLPQPWCLAQIQRCARNLQMELAFARPPAAFAFTSPAAGPSRTCSVPSPSPSTAVDLTACPNQLSTDCPCGAAPKISARHPSTLGPHPVAPLTRLIARSLPTNCLPKRNLSPHELSRLAGSFSFVEVGNAMELESLLKGKTLPAYENLASYVFYTATAKISTQNASITRRASSVKAPSTMYICFMSRTSTT